MKGLIVSKLPQGPWRRFTYLHFLFKAHWILLLVALIWELLTFRTPLFTLSTLIIGPLLYAYYSKSFKKMYYTFWTLSFFHLVFVFYKTLYWNAHPISFIYGMSLMVLLVVVYAFSSPIFYPRVAWWEYDFRFRGDIKIHVQMGNLFEEGRLTDLRRGAGCVQLFSELSLGDIIEICPFNWDKSFKAQILSIREPLLGRGLIYGVEFLFDTPHAKSDYLSFRQTWKRNGSAKRRQKFKS